MDRTRRTGDPDLRIEPDFGEIVGPSAGVAPAQRELRIGPSVGPPDAAPARYGIGGPEAPRSTSAGPHDGSVDAAAETPDAAIVPPRRPRRASGLLWATAGFAAGVAFWHAVGFWGFVSEAVFSGPRTGALAVAADAADRRAAAGGAIARVSEGREARGQPLTTGAIPPGPLAADAANPAAAGVPGGSDCASFVLDRATGAIVPHDCPASTFTLPVLPERGRADAEAAETGRSEGAEPQSSWATEVAAPGAGAVVSNGDRR